MRPSKCIEGAKCCVAGVSVRRVALPDVCKRMWEVIGAWAWVSRGNEETAKSADLPLQDGTAA